MRCTTCTVHLYHHVTHHLAYSVRMWPCGRPSSAARDDERSIYNVPAPPASSAAPAGRAAPNRLQPDVSQWTERDVGTWLGLIGMGQYHERFSVNDVNGRVLLRMSNNILRDAIR